MIAWRYRPINNRVARKKWILIVLSIFIVGLIYTFYRIIMGQPLGRSLMTFTIFSLFVFLYSLIALGRPRTYVLDGNTVFYKPFKAKIEDYSADYENLLIRVKGNLFVRTLYFEREEDFEEALRYLNKNIKIKK